MPPQSGQFIERDRSKIGRQITLPLGKAVEIAVKSLRIRFWRSMITMAGIVRDAGLTIDAFKALL